MPEAQQSDGVLDYGHFDYGDFFDEPLVPNDGWGLLCTANEELICSAPTPNLFCGARAEPDSPPVETGPGPATPQATPVAVREREEAIRGDAVSVDIVGIAVDAASPAKPRGSVLDEFVRLNLAGDDDDPVGPSALPTAAPTAAVVAVELAWTSADNGTLVANGTGFVANGTSAAPCDGVPLGGGGAADARYAALALAIDPIAVSNVTCAVVPGRRLDDAAPRRCAGAVERYSVVVVVRDLVSADAADDAAASTSSASGAWHKNGAPSKDCDWVRSHPPRCAAVGWDGAVAAAACRGACGCSRPPTAAPTSEALFWFDFDDPSGGTDTGYGDAFVDASGNGHAISDSSGSSRTTGPFGTPARFLGALHGFALDDVAPALAGAGPRTLGAWLRIDAFDGGYALEIGGGAAACENFGLRAGWSEGALELAFKGDCAVSVADAGLAAGGGTTSRPLTGAVDDLFAYGAALDADAVRALRDRGGRTYAPTPRPLSPTAATRPPSPAPTARGTPAPSVEHCAHGRGLDFAEFVVDDEIGSPSFTWGVDLDQDGDMDVLTTSLHDNTVAWSENDGNQSFTERLLTSTAMSAAFASYGDVNEDGAFDVLAVSWGDNTTRLFVNDGAMSFFEVQLDSEEAPTDVVVFDFDGDGDTDVLAASWYKGTIFWFEGHGELATYYAKAYIAEGLAGPWNVFPADIDSDADLDVLAATGYDFAVTWYENDGNMTFAVRVVDTEVIQPREVVARDGDGDGDVDLFVAVRGASELVWYEDDGRQNWEKIVIADDAYGAYTICPTDLDGDGDIDVVGASKEKDEIPWYENDGAMGFGEHMVSTTAVGVRYSIVADMDSDADLDVVAALAGRDCTVWYENGCENQDYAPATSLLALGLEASSAPDSLMTIIAEAEGYDDDVD
ncbi:6-phosphogluconolactonase [Aureococcus anophagefferens]|nr:6-phosphogluconolactonase [Aureococcus anophagefferens]